MPPIRNTQKSFFAGHFVGSSQDSGVLAPRSGPHREGLQDPYIHCHNRKELHDSLKQMLETEGPVIWRHRFPAGPGDHPRPCLRRKLPDGRMVSRPLHEMAPLLSEDEIRENMTFLAFRMAKAAKPAGGRINRRDHILVRCRKS